MHKTLAAASSFWARIISVSAIEDDPVAPPSFNDPRPRHEQQQPMFLVWIWRCWAKSFVCPTYVKDTSGNIYAIFWKTKIQPQTHHTLV
jgi:hypothetical protein